MIKPITSFVAKQIPTHTLDIFGKDSLLTRTLPYYMLSLITVFTGFIHYLTDNPYIVLFVIYAIVPLLDSVFTLDSRNPDSKETQHLLDRGWQF